MGVMRSYWKHPELTRSVLANGCVCTNDIGYFDEEGYAYIIGRRDDVINFNGIKISLVEIEDVVTAHFNVQEAACIGKADPVAGQVPVLFVVPKNLQTFNRGEFYSYLTSRLDRTKMPKSVEIIESLPRTHNGKLNRKVLEDL